MKMRVTRPFIFAGTRQEIGTELEIDDRSLSGMLRHEGKATPLEAVDTSGPMTTETVSGVIAGSKPKAVKAAATSDASEPAKAPT
jgi:hypothetical protein